ncbi:MAG: 30S ribosomal protein S8 [Candidatus Gracilibacteria bacterium]|jgi:small subunit ribosomal protein S8|nr:30S ribosomal protein S8 [Candidatus Gracilibacteria bacterium]
MYTDPIADLLTRIRNAQKANKMDISIPYSKIKEEILSVMKKYRFIVDYKIEGEKVSEKVLSVVLDENRSGTELNRISSPGQRIYKGSNELKRLKSGLGIQILSTSKGIMSNIDAKKQNLGGEVLCEIL